MGADTKIRDEDKPMTNPSDKRSAEPPEVILKETALMLGVNIVKADQHVEEHMKALSAAGYQIVPVEPTEEMWSAGREPILDRDAKSPPCIVVERSWFNPEKDSPPREDGHVPKGDTAVWVYRAMLKAHGGE